MLRRSRTANVFWFVPLVLLLVLFLFFLTSTYPSLGHDYEMFFRYLVAGRWHWAHYGLAPLRYAVHLCGGLPLYGHPNDLSYSLTQLLALTLNPWHAALMSFSLMLAAGYAGWYRVSRDMFRLERPWAHALSLIVAAHGFHLMHALVGHLNFSTMPLLGWLLWLLYGRDTLRCTPAVRAACFALLSAVILHAAGYFTLLFFALLAAALLPLVMACRTRLGVLPVVAIPMRVCTLATVSLLLCGSKLIAIAALMRTFPRELGMSMLDPGMHPLGVALSSLWSIPQTPELLGGLPWGLHENSHFLSPVVIVGAVAGVTLLAMALRRKTCRELSFFVLTYAMFLVAACFALMQGGPLAKLLHAVPLLSAMRVMMRFVYPFSLLLATGSVIALQAVVIRYAHKRHRTYAAASMLVTLVAVALAYTGSYHRLDLRPQPELILRQAEAARIANFEHLPVTGVLQGDTDFLGNSGAQCNGDALFLSAGWQWVPGLVAGPTAEVRDGAFNLLNPSCLAYPRENGCRPGVRIAAADVAGFRAFTAGEPLMWKVSASQSVADIVSLITLVACVGTVMWCTVQSRRRVSLGR